MSAKPLDALDVSTFSDFLRDLFSHFSRLLFLQLSVAAKLTLLRYPG